MEIQKIVLKNPRSLLNLGKFSNSPVIIGFDDFSGPPTISNPPSIGHHSECLNQENSSKIKLLPISHIKPNAFLPH